MSDDDWSVVGREARPAPKPKATGGAQRRPAPARSSVAAMAEQERLLQSQFTHATAFEALESAAGKRIADADGPISRKPAKKDRAAMVAAEQRRRERENARKRVEAFEGEEVVFHVPAVEAAKAARIAKDAKAREDAKAAKEAAKAQRIAAAAAAAAAAADLLRANGAQTLNSSTVNAMLLGLSATYKTRPDLRLLRMVEELEAMSSTAGASHSLRDFDYPSRDVSSDVLAVLIEWIEGQPTAAVTAFVPLLIEWLTSVQAHARSPFGETNGVGMKVAALAIARGAPEALHASIPGLRSRFGSGGNIGAEVVPAVAWLFMQADTPSATALWFQHLSSFMFDKQPTIREAALTTAEYMVFSKEASDECTPADPEMFLGGFNQVLGWVANGKIPDRLQTVIYTLMTPATLFGDGGSVPKQFIKPMLDKCSESTPLPLREVASQVVLECLTFDPEGVIPAWKEAHHSNPETTARLLSAMQNKRSRVSKEVAAILAEAIRGANEIVLSKGASDAVRAEIAKCQTVCDKIAPEQAKPNAGSRKSKKGDSEEEAEEEEAGHGWCHALLRLFLTGAVAAGGAAVWAHYNCRSHEWCHDAVVKAGLPWLTKALQV